MDDLRRELDAGCRPGARQTVAEYLMAWLEAERARVRPATWSYVRLYLLPAIGGTTLAELHPGTSSA